MGQGFLRTVFTTPRVHRIVKKFDTRVFAIEDLLQESHKVWKESGAYVKITRFQRRESILSRRIHFQLLTAAFFLFLNQKLAIAQPAPRISVVAMGDSLSAGGYRQNGWKVGAGFRWDLKLMESWVGAELEFRGTLSDGPVAQTRLHEGYSGKRIEEIQDLSRGNLNNLKPDVVLLMVGTNDVIQNYHLKALKQRLLSLMVQIQTELPINAHILWGVPIPTNNPDFNRRLEVLETAILDLKKMKLPRVTFLNFYRNAKITSTDLIDGVHPSFSGNKKMADHWAKGLRCLRKKVDCQFL